MAAIQDLVLTLKLQSRVSLWLSVLGAWKDDNKPTSNSGGANDRQWAEFSPTESSTEISSSLKDELYEEHSSSDEDVDRSSSPELAGEEGEVLLRYVQVLWV